MLGRLFSNNVDDRQKTEIMLSITPRVVRNVQRAPAQTAEFWSGTEAALRTQPIALKAVAAPAAAAGAVPPPVPAAAPGASAPAPVAIDAGTAGAVAPAAAATAGAVAPAAATAVDLRWTGPTQVRAGEELTLQLNARLSEQMTNASLQIAFDPEAFAVTEVRDGGLMSSGNARSFLSHKVDAARGRLLVTINRSGAGGAIGDGVLLEVKFKPLGPAPKTPVEVIGVSPMGPGGRSVTAAIGARHEFSAQAK
jgi:general secretion pathway protein D